MKAVFDTNLLVSAFLSRDEPGGVSSELLRFVRQGTIDLFLSPDIVAEVLTTLVGSPRLQQRYDYDASMVLQFCDDLRGIATPVDNPPATPGAVPRDPDDDKIIACAVAAGAEYLVTRDRDLLSLNTYGSIKIVDPEDVLRTMRQMS